MDEAEQNADRIGIMKQGELVKLGHKSELGPLEEMFMDVNQAPELNEEEYINYQT
jgi:ABC-type multidrug transport system ATPase subunit